MVLAAVAAGVGIVVERWLFFAEARHTVINYYQSEFGSRRLLQDSPPRRRETSLATVGNALRTPSGIL
jgi:hypothetical protein